MTRDESAAFEALGARLVGLEGAAFMSAFVRAPLKPGVEPPPPPTSTSPEMQKRPAAVATLMHAFTVFQSDRTPLQASPFPVFLGYGDLTHEAEPITGAALARLCAS